MVRRYISLIGFVFLATPALAGDLSGNLVLGAGADDVLDQTDTTAAAFVAEYHGKPFYAGMRASYALGGAAQVDADSDFWVGVGVTALWTLSDRWFAEGSLMPGYYDMGSGGTDLGGNFQFRTLVGIGYRLGNGARLSLAIDHKSNASTNSRNPGSETLALRYAFPL